MSQQLHQGTIGLRELSQFANRHARVCYRQGPLPYLYESAALEEVGIKTFHVRTAELQRIHFNSGLTFSGTRRGIQTTTRVPSYCSVRILTCRVAFELSSETGMSEMTTVRSLIFKVKMSVRVRVLNVLTEEHIIENFVEFEIL